MKFNFDENPGALMVSAYARGWIRVRDTRIDSPCVIVRDAIHADLLPPTLAALEAAHLERLLTFSPEIILLGTGERQQFVDYALTRALADVGVGLEVMDTGAACRSFNILVAEDRAVLAALFMI